MFPTEKLLKDVSNLKSQDIIIIGDIMLDEHLWCSVTRISPEAPVPICKVDKIIHTPGGAGNVASNIQALGCNPQIIGCIGKDSSAEKLLSTFKTLNITNKHLVKTTDRPTILKSRVIAHHQHVARVDIEKVDAISSKIQNYLIKKFTECIKTAKAVIISDYGKGTLVNKLVARIISHANKANIPVIIDPKGDNYKKYKGAYVITPNRAEFEAFIKNKIKSEKDYLKYGSRIIKEAGLQYLMITRSEEGMSIITKDQKKIDIPTKAKDVFDITGAGDTVISALAVGLANGLSVEKAAHIANYAAGIVVGKVGSATTNLEEIISAIKKDSQNAK